MPLKVLIWVGGCVLNHRLAPCTHQDYVFKRDLTNHVYLFHQMTVADIGYIDLDPLLLVRVREHPVYKLPSRDDE